MANITLSEQEKEILLLGQEFKKLKDSPAYQKLISWLDEYVDKSQKELVLVMEATVGMDEVAKAALVVHQRMYLRELLETRVNAIVAEAKTLAESIAEEARDAEI